MSSMNRKEKLVNKKVTYTLLKYGQFYIVENVPARVDVETRESRRWESLALIPFLLPLASHTLCDFPFLVSACPS